MAPSSRLEAQWLAVGAAIGAGVRVAMKNIPVGVGLGAVFGVLIAALRGAQAVVRRQSVPG